MLDDRSLWVGFFLSLSLTLTAFSLLRLLTLRAIQTAAERVRQIVVTNEQASTRQFELLSERLELIEEMLQRLQRRLERMAGNA